MRRTNGSANAVVPVLQLIALKAALFLYIHMLLDDTGDDDDIHERTSSEYLVHISCPLLDDVNDANRGVPACHRHLLRLSYSERKEDGAGSCGTHVRRGGGT